jgi:transcription-repair coupling factor (superfamily II helicase)
MSDPKSGNAQLISAGGLTPGSFAYLLPELASHQGRLRAVVLAPDDTTAEKFYRDLEFYQSFRPRAWGDAELLYLPGWEQSPYRNLQPGLSARFERIGACQRLALASDEQSWVLVASLHSYLQAAASIEFLRESFPLKKGKAEPPEAIVKKLIRFGYTSAESVEDPGTYSLRGGILDLFPPTLDNPVRAEFFEDEIESLRIFNPETQRSVRLLGDGDELMVGPAREFPADADSLAKGRERLKEWCDQHDLPRNARERISSLLSQGVLTAEMDYLLPFFQDGTSWVSDITCNGSVLALLEPESIAGHYETWRERQQELFEASLAKQNPFPEPNLLHQEMPAAFNAPCWRAKMEVRELALGEELPRAQRLRLASRKRSADVSGLEKQIEELKVAGTTSVIVANSQTQLDRILFILSQHKVRSVNLKSEAELPKDPSIVGLAQGALTESFHLPERKIAFFSEDEIFGEKSHTAKRKRNKAPVAVEDLAVGDLVVHREHGIGKYVGLTRVTALGNENDFAILEYSDGDKLYVPVYRLDSLSRYVAAPGGSAAAMDKLGSGSFAKTKKRVEGAIKDIAQDLLKVQAERTMQEGYAFNPPDDEFRSFEAEFPFDETVDQAKAIEDSIEDMTNARPMDRLICGDVGFGKTEVAIRAAFKAAQDGKQVAVLVPTTILAEQHYLSFSNRMANYPMRLASISRFKSRKEQQAIVEDVAAGKIDIVIGTHRILSKDMKFKDLGLIVIDEEQRFGVEHKEKLKQLRATCDVLTLSATPIPRTLQMSLMGLKDVSIIRTPPGDRLSIKTHLATFDDDLIQSAIRNELGRGGQVFFIHNRVQTIGKIEALVKKLVPEAKVITAHGQMPEGALERAMIGFYQKQFDVLIATAIIENGLDVPNANTLIVNRADAFGLSQLYQIRGRVGRSQTRAFAYFLVPDTATLTEDARERLSVLQRFVDLGSGYTIAQHDLEIRGGGDVLGQQQSGHIGSVGYELYLEMLQTEIHRIKGEEVTKPKEEVEINVPFTAALPQNYVTDMKARLLLYRRLSAASTEEEAESAQRELIDRYGPLPREAQELVQIVRIKVLMRRLGLKSLTLGPKGISLVAGKDPALSPAVVLSLVHTYPTEYSIHPDGKLAIRGQFHTGADLYKRLRRLMETNTQ